MTEKTKISIEKANELVIIHSNWAKAISKSVARAWSLHYKNDGLESAAFEALIFCSRRFDEEMGVPFKSYARRRVHESATDAARKCKNWVKEEVNNKRTTRLSKKISADLFELFPHLRTGKLNFEEGSENDNIKVSVKQLLVSACLVATKYGSEFAQPDKIIEYKRMTKVASIMEIIHQLLIWNVYWEGSSLRGVARDWETDELNVIREHTVLLEFLITCLNHPNQIKPPRIRPGLKNVDKKLKTTHKVGVFTKLINKDLNE